MSSPKSLAERLQWMADNLPGFKAELDAVNEAEAHRRAVANSAATPARSRARTAVAAHLGNPALNPDSFSQNSTLRNSKVSDD